MLVITKESEEHQTKHPITYCIIHENLKKVFLNSLLDFLKPSIKREKKNITTYIVFFVSLVIVSCFVFKLL